MGKGLLSTIQSWYVDEDNLPINEKSRTRGRNQGRFIQLILCELAAREPKLFKKILREHLVGLPNEPLFVEKEYAFNSQLINGNSKAVKEKTRYADLAIFTQKGENARSPVALVEIKYNDNFIDGQLAAYIAECKKSKSKLLILSKDTLLPVEQDMLKQAQKEGVIAEHCLLGGLSAFLVDSTTSAISSLFFDYLKDEGLIMKPVDTNLLYRFFHRLVNQWGDANQIQSRAFALGGASQFQSVLSNMALIGDSIREALKLTRIPSVDFSISPYIKTTSKGLKQSVSTKGNYEIKYSDRIGGHVFVYSQFVIFNNKQNSNQLSIDFGFDFYVESNKEQLFDLFFYAKISSKELKKTDPDCEIKLVAEKLRSNSLEKMFDKGYVEKKFIKLIAKAIKQATESQKIKQEEHLLALKTLSGCLP